MGRFKKKSRNLVQYSHKRKRSSSIDSYKENCPPTAPATPAFKYRRTVLLQPLDVTPQPRTALKSPSPSQHHGWTASISPDENPIDWDTVWAHDVDLNTAPDDWLQPDDQTEGLPPNPSSSAALPLVREFQRTSVEVFEEVDEDTPAPRRLDTWDGERSFWMRGELEEDDEDMSGWREEDEDERHEPFRFFDDPDGEHEDDDADTEQRAFEKQRKGGFKWPPSREEAEEAVQDIAMILKPPKAQPKGKGYKKCAVDDVTRQRLEGMRMFLAAYIRLEAEDPEKFGNWGLAAKETAKSMLKGRWKEVVPPSDIKNPGAYYARHLCRRAHAFIKDRSALPGHNWGGCARSAIDDPDIAQDIHLHLQSKGKYIRAEDIVRYCGTPEMLVRLKRTKTISLATARIWLVKMGYRWTRNAKGQYVDGHERVDVVDQRQRVFVPRMKFLQHRMRRYFENHGWDIPPCVLRAVVVWFHDESTFYAHDRRQSVWLHHSTTATPQKKGEGVSLMVADFVSADYGFLTSPDGTEDARVYFKAGKGREGYFQCEDIIAQAERAIKILREHYTDEDHVFVYDNATTHQKREEDALSALSMSKGPSKSLEKNFGVWVDQIDEDGRVVYGEGEDRQKPLKEKVRMRDTTYNGATQKLYWPEKEGDPMSGLFKGMQQILVERGYNEDVLKKKKAQCGTSFKKCTEGSVDCCVRRIMYLQPDFVNVESILVKACRKLGVEVLFLPKFHCELNFIEMCWGYAKRCYRLLPESSNEADLKRNVVFSLAEIPLITMQRFATRCLRFVDAYQKGLNGKQAAWAAKKYRGHRMIPENILEELDKAHITAEY